MPTKNSFKKYFLNSSVLFYTALFIILTYRFQLAVEAPTETTDVLRHLGFSRHAFENYFSLYNKLPTEFCPEVWCDIWPDVKYIYPPVALWFFFSFSFLKLGIAWVKIVLTIIEFFNALFLEKFHSRLACVIYFLAPVSIWFTSHEGAYEPLQTFLCFISIYFFINEKWLRSGLFYTLAIQTKFLVVFLFPWFLYELLKIKNRSNQTRAIMRMLIGGLVGLLPFMGYYIQSPHFFKYVGSLDVGYYNPFAWNVFNKALFSWNSNDLIYWHGFFSYLIILILVAGIIWDIKKKKAENAIEQTPLLISWIYLKSMKWVQFWYTIATPVFFIPFRNKKKLFILMLAIYALHSARSLNVLFDRRFRIFESQGAIHKNTKCLWYCDQFLEK